MVIINICHRQYHIDQSPDNVFNIPAGSSKKSIIPIDISSCHSAAESISELNKAMKPIYCIQIIKTRVFPVRFVAVSDNTICNPRKYMIPPQAVTHDKCPICEMSLKDTDEFFCPGFRSVDSGCKTYPFRWIPVQMHTYSLKMPLFSALSPCLRSFLYTGLSGFFPFISQGQRSHQTPIPRQDRHCLFPKATVMT